MSEADSQDTGISGVTAQPGEVKDYRAIFEATGDGVIIADMAGRLVDVNPALCQMHGYPREEMLNLYPTDFIHPDFHGIFAEYMASLNAGRPYRATALNLRKDGSAFPVEVNGTIFTFRGEPHVLGVVRDVSDRVGVETQLREREEQYRSIFESTTDGLIIRDLNGHVVEANPATCRIYGYDREEMIGLDVRDLIHPDDHHLVVDNQQSIGEGRTFQSRAVHLHKDGSSFHVEAHGAAFLFKGEPHVLIVIRDITESVEAEKAVREERQRISRELHDSVSQALYGIALGARTTASLLDSDLSRASESNEYVLTLAETGLAEMRALIFELRPEVLEQEGLSGALERQVSAVQARHQIEVKVIISNEPDVSLPVKEALYRIAQEAVQNAIKHAQPERLELRMETTDVDVALEVRDNGKGFDPGASFPGHLGLKSMRERAERAGGTLQVESRAGVGTMIRVQVPC